MRHKYRTSQVEHVVYDISVEEEERFWSLVEITDTCWLWKLAPSSGGYGFFYVHGEKIPAHRLSWFLRRHYLPVGLDVCHTCDESYPIGDVTYRRCVRPQHLFLGTNHDNMMDMLYKERSVGTAFVSSADRRAYQGIR